MLKCVESCGPRHPPDRVPWARCQKIFKFTSYTYIFFKKPNKKVYNRAKKLYCDTTIFFVVVLIVF